MSRTATVVRTVTVIADATLTRDMPEWDRLTDLMEDAGRNIYWASKPGMGGTAVAQEWQQVHDAADVALGTGNLMLGKLLLDKWGHCTCGCVEGGYPCEVGTMGAGC